MPGRRLTGKPGKPSQAEALAILKCVSEGVLHLDADGRVRWMNETAEHILGCTVDDFALPASDIRAAVLRPDGSHLPVDHLPGITALKTGRAVHHVEYGFPLKHGGIRWCLGAAEPILDRSGVLTGAVVTMQDVTERRLDEAISRARARVIDFAVTHETVDTLRFFLDRAEEVTSSSVGFFHFLDEDQRTLWLQAWSTRTMLEFCRAEGAGSHYPVGVAGIWADAVHHRRSIIYNDYASVPHRKGLPPGHAEVRRFVSVPIIRGSQIVAVFGVGNKHTDYTERDVAAALQLADLTWDIIASRRSVEAMRLVEARHQTVIETAMDGFLMCDAAGAITEANQTYCQMTGYALADLRRMRVADLADPDVTDELSAQIERLSQEGESRFETRQRRRDGTTFPVEVSLQCKASTGGRHVMFVRDITDSQRLQAQVLQSQRVEAVGRLAGGVAHDFNNMLGVIVGRAEMALEHVGATHPLRDVLTEILSAARRSSDLTQQLLAFARRQPVAPAVLDLNDTVGGMLKMLSRLIGERINLIWRPGLNLPPVKIDRSQIDQVLANLCVNARDAIAGVGSITIETDALSLDEAYCAAHPECAPGDYVMLTVRDTGCGMDAATLANVFDPFFTTKGFGQGTGLGLATVYGVVKQNGGSISVASKVGAGTVFTLFFPRHAGRPESHLRLHSVNPSPPSGQETILLVEDEPALLDLTATVLADLGYTVLAAAKPSEAMRLASEHAGAIELLVTDIIMPEMNGRDLARLVHSQFPHIKCLFMSGYSDEPIVQDSATSEGVNFIQKPWSRQALADRVRDVLDQRSRRR